MVETEQDFSQLFVDSCSCSASERDFVAETATQYWTDLTSHLNGYFSNDDRQLITQQAALALSANLKNTSPEEAWKNVIRDFAANRCWGFEIQNKKPAKAKTEEQKIFWRFFKYTWALFQAMVLVKIAILFFGLRSAQNPDQNGSIGIWIVCAFSLASLGYFAYRNRNDTD